MRRLKTYLREEGANAAIEAGFLFPVLVSILCGTIDIGIGLVTNMKVTNACQIVADLVSRDADVTQVEIDDAVVAGRMAILPYSAASYGVDIVGIQYVGATLTPTVRWRDTVNMEPNLEVLERSEGLGLQDEGVIAVSVRYTYQPYFSEFLLSTINMEEEAYVRGRKGLFVAKV